MIRTRPVLSLLLHSWGLPALIPLAVLEYIGARDHVTQVLRHSLAVLDSTNGVLIVMNPLIAALTCAETLVLTRGPRWEAASVLPDGGLRMLAGRVMATAGWCMALHVVVAGSLVGWSAATTPASIPSLWSLAPSLLSIAAYAAVGAFIGRAWNALMAPPIVAVGLYLLALYVEQNFPDPLVEFGGATADLLGLRHRPEVLAGQSVWLAVIICAALVTAVATTRGYPRLLRRGTASVAIVACCAVGLGSLGNSRFEPMKVTYRCQGRHPQVCVRADNVGQLNKQHRRVTAAVRQVALLGVTLPDRFEQQTAASDYANNVGYFPVPGPGQTSTYQDLVLNIVMSVACHPEGGPSWSWKDVRRVTSWATWLHGHPQAKGSQHERTLRSTARQALERIASCG